MHSLHPPFGWRFVLSLEFHPQSNGMIELFHHSLKSSLRARLAGSDWVAHQPLVMLCLQASPKNDFGFSPAEAVFSSTLSLPGEFLEHSKIPPEIFSVELSKQSSVSPDLLDIT